MGHQGLNRLRELLDTLSEFVGGPHLTRHDLARHFQRSLKTIHNWHRTGKLPPAVYLPGKRTPFWRPIDIARCCVCKVEAKPCNEPK